VKYFSSGFFPINWLCQHFMQPIAFRRLLILLSTVQVQQTSSSQTSIESVKLMKTCKEEVVILKLYNGHKCSA